MTYKEKQNAGKLIAEDILNGMSVLEAAQKYNISTRTVYRALTEQQTKIGGRPKLQRFWKSCVDQMDSGGDLSYKHFREKFIEFFGFNPEEESDETPQA